MTTLVVEPARRDVAVISLIGLAHGTSHFLQLVMPTLFLAIRHDWDISFAQLGLAATVFYVSSGICQTLAGFAVDRYGARPVLYAGLALMAGATGLMGLAPNFQALVVCSAIAGVGNSMFHPADYGILNASVSVKRLGPAFSAHGITGNIGWALAPPVMTAFALWFGGWRGALIGAALIGFAVLALIVSTRDLFEPLPEEQPSSASTSAAAGATVLLSAPILACFLFFAFLATGLIGIQAFGIPILNQTYGLSVQSAAATLTVFLIASGVGVLCGGALTTWTCHHEHVAAAGMALAAVCIAIIAAASPPAWAIPGFLAAAGFFSGSTNPSRDLLVRAAAPKGSTGKVYGFVYSGLDVGSALAPLAFGWLLDHGRGAVVIYTVAAIWLSTVVTIYMMKSAIARRGVARG